LRHTRRCNGAKAQRRYGESIPDSSREYNLSVPPGRVISPKGAKKRQDRRQGAKKDEADKKQ